MTFFLSYFLLIFPILILATNEPTLISKYPTNCAQINEIFSHNDACKCYVDMPDFDIIDLQAQSIDSIPSNYSLLDMSRSDHQNQSINIISNIWIGCSRSDSSAIIDSLSLLPSNTQISKLWLWDNAMPKLVPPMFQSIITDKLIIEQNRLGDLISTEQAFQHMASDLRHLILRNNLISLVKSGVFGHLSELRTLDLSYNRLKSLSVNLMHAKSQSQLRYLSFRSNQITSLSGKPFLTMGHLDHLNLANNKLTKIDDKAAMAFEGLHNLTVLHLDHNLIESISIDMFKFMPKLNTLNLGWNRLVSFGGLGQNFPSLTQLYLNANLLKRWPQIGAKNLKLLNVDENLLTAIERDDLAPIMQNLKVLSAISNRIDRLDLPPGMPHLKILSLQNNSLQQLTNGIFGNVPELQKLYLSRNRLQLLQKGAFEGSPKLAVLNLARNELKWPLDGSIFGNVPKLNRLYLNRNKLTVVDKQFLQQLNHIAYLNLADNPWLCNCDLADLSVWMSQNSAARVVNVNDTLCTSDMDVRHFVQWWAVSPEYVEAQCPPVDGQHGPSLVVPVDSRSATSHWLTALAFVLGVSSILMLLIVVCLFFKDAHRQKKLSEGTFGASFDCDLNRRESMNTDAASNNRSLGGATFAKTFLRRVPTDMASLIPKCRNCPSTPLITEQTT